MDTSHAQPFLPPPPPFRGSRSLALLADILYLHLDDQMDAKSLMGTYVCTSRPGEFAWQPGPLTQAVVQGRWVVIEDVNVASADVLAALIPLAERRTLRVSQLGQDLRASPDFALFATVTSAPAGAAAGAYASSRSAIELLGGLFHHVYVESPGTEDQLEILRGMHPTLESLLPLVLESIDVVRVGFRQTALDAALPRAREAAERHGIHRLDVAAGRHFGLRDALKWCARMETVHASLLARTASQLRDRDMPLPLRVASFAEALDCLSGLVASGGARLGLARALADVWGLPTDDADAALLLHRPAVSVEHGVLAVGRARVPRAVSGAETHEGAADSFAYTSHALRLMERVAVAVVSNEPVLLVGESGVGKTTVVQQIAKQVRRDEGGKEGGRGGGGVEDLQAGRTVTGGRGKPRVRGGRVGAGDCVRREARGEARWGPRRLSGFVSARRRGQALGRRRRRVATRLRGRPQSLPSPPPPPLPLAP